MEQRKGSGTRTAGAEEDTEARQAKELKEKDEKIAALQAQLDAKTTIRIAVSKQGGVSVYGLGRFPVTLYAEQWQRLPYPKVMAFIESHEKELSWKE